MIHQLAKFVLWSWVGYVVTTKLAPIVQAKLETHNLDDMWDVYSAAWEEDHFSE